MKKTVLSVLAVFPLAAHSAVPPSVSQAITDAGSDGATISVFVLLALVAFAAYRLMRKAIGGY